MSLKHSQVVVGFDFSTSGRAALERAVAIAGRAPFHVLHFVCAIDSHTPFAAVPATGPVDYRYAERVQQALADVVRAQLVETNITERIHFYIHARFGKAADEILKVAREVGADLIVVGSKGATGIERFVLGSVSEKVVREAGCSVEVARPRTYPHVELLDVVEVEPHHTYVPPHRYSYESNRMDLRPRDWPLY